MLPMSDLLPADTDMPAPAMTTTFCRLCSMFITRSRSSCCSGSTTPDRKSRYSVVRSLGPRDILLRFAGGGPSLSVLDSIPSGAGEQVCEVCCDAVGEGYACSGRAPPARGMLSGGSGELAGELSGEERRLAGGEESGLESSDSYMSSIVENGKPQGSEGRCTARRSGASSGYLRDDCIVTLIRY